jgi:hypothetical protein
MKAQLIRVIATARGVRCWVRWSDGSVTEHFERY